MFFWVYFILYNQPLKMGPTEGSETSANHNMTPGKYPEHTQYKNHITGTTECTFLFPRNTCRMTMGLQYIPVVVTLVTLEVDKKREIVRAGFTA
jgi:hypothetical protein